MFFKGAYRNKLVRPINIFSALLRNDFMISICGNPRLMVDIAILKLNTHIILCIMIIDFA